MDRYQYLMLMGLCLLITLPLEFLFGARVWRRPRRLLAALLPPAAVLIVWDMIAVARDHWSFNEKYTTGWEIAPGFPLDEVVFFLAIPICALLTFEAVRNVLARVGGRSR
ncbi:MAG: lycopene cyclase domain-containing protein [Actinomycetota bacterium]|nr:lycopene cyclase domain-containing protein [Actinomycetota bacterium]